MQAQLAALEEAVGELDVGGRDDAPLPVLDPEAAPPPPRSAARETRRPAAAETVRIEPVKPVRPAAETVRIEPAQAVAEAAKSSRPDRRRSVRRQGPPVPLLLSYSKNGDDPFKGWVNDASGTGLGVTVEWALPVSSILTVRPQNSPARLKWVQIEAAQLPQGARSLAPGLPLFGGPAARGCRGLRAVISRPSPLARGAGDEA